MLRARGAPCRSAAHRPTSGSLRCTSATRLRSVQVQSASFRTSTIVFAKDAGKKADTKKEGKVAKTGQKKDSGPAGREDDKKKKKSKEEIAAERRERKAKENERKIKLAKKKRNFWDIAARSKDYGVGLQMRRSIWPPENQTFWTVKRVTIKNTDPLRGKAWGIFTWRGKPQEEEKKISGIYKREWSIYTPDPNAPKLVEQEPSAAHIEPPRPILHALYGRAPTKHQVPRTRYGPLPIDTSFHRLTEEERKPIPGILAKRYHNFDLPPPPAKPPKFPTIIGADAILAEAKKKADKHPERFNWLKDK